MVAVDRSRFLQIETDNRGLIIFVLGRPTLVRKALSFTHELSFFSFLFLFYFFINPVHRAQQQRSGWSS